MPTRAPLRASRDRWLVSYADFVTILLACFATTYAASQTPQAAAPVPTIEKRTVPPPPRTPAAPAARPSLRDAVAPLVAASNSNIALIDDARGVVISLPESASFPTGSAALTTTARSFLRELAASLQSTNAVVRIEGHTDDVPVAGGRYGSNWELSTARASAVVAFLISDALFAPERLSAAGYAEFHPRVANDSPESRSLNRRVDVVLMDPDTR